MSNKILAQGKHQPLITSPTTKVGLQRHCSCGQHACGGECDACRKKQMNLHRGRWRRSEPTPVPAIVHDVLHSPGKPLDPATRIPMESRFGRDFSEVRVHTDTQAVESTRMGSAQAYTVGQHIVLAADQTALNTREGQGLLAHELAHVIQQTGGGNPSSPRAPLPHSGPIRVTTSGDRFEREAEAAQVAVAQGRSIQRQEFTQASATVMAPAGSCVGDYFNLAAATLSAIGACGGAVALWLAPEPTTLTKWAAGFATVGCIGAISWVISAIISLRECLETDPDANRQEIEQLRRRQRFLEERLRELQNATGQGEREGSGQR